MKDIKEEFSSTEFIDAYFKAATVCSRATEEKLKKLRLMEDNQSSAEDLLNVQLTSTGDGSGDVRLHSDDDEEDNGSSSSNEEKDDEDEETPPTPSSPPPTPLTVKRPIATKPTIKGRHAILVLGPSAVGKTFSTKNALATVLERNGWMSDMMFLSIDGGIMRETSKTWTTMKELPRQVRDML